MYIFLIFIWFKKKWKTVLKNYFGAESSFALFDLESKKDEEIRI